MRPGTSVLGASVYTTSCRSITGAPAASEGNAGLSVASCPPAIGVMAGVPVQSLAVPAVGAVVDAT